MKYRILRITLMIFIVGVIFAANKGWEKLMRDSAVQAFGELLVNFHVAPGTPIFNLINMKPGDSSSRPIDVSNGGSVSRFVQVKGIRTGGIGLDPKLETVLDVIIKDGVNPLYGFGSSTGPKTMANFFADSTSVDGIPLNVINSGGAKTYNFLVNFPNSAGNQFQAKSVTADISFGIQTANNIVINEVFYSLDNSHGLKSPKEKDENDDEWECRRGRSRQDQEKNKNKRFKFQWIELYNPTDKEISLKNWTVSDNSGIARTIHANKKIKAGGFALISKDASVWRFWNENRRAEKIELGKIIGNGLDKDGDRLILKDKNGVEADKISWGSDTSAFSPAISAVGPGHSSERLAPGFDTNLASDFVNLTHPTPGN